jgi:branched-chain amino acid aminotransferase
MPGQPWSKTWTFHEGDWHEGNIPIMGVRDHAAWLCSSVFDGARTFEGVSPDLDLHCARVNASAETMHLKPLVSEETWMGLARDGSKRFDKDAALYIRPMYWAERSGSLLVAPDLESTKWCLSLYEAPMRKPEGFSITLSPYRKPSLECMPVNAKAGCLYPNNARALLEANARGYEIVSCSTFSAMWPSSRLPIFSSQRTGSCLHLRRTEHFSTELPVNG